MMWYLKFMRLLRNDTTDNSTPLCVVSITYVRLFNKDVLKGTIQENRVSIKFHLKLGKTASGRYDVLQTSFGEDVLSKALICLSSSPPPPPPRCCCCCCCYLF